MNEMPDDVRKTAEVLWLRALDDGTPDAAIMIAQALMAERRRCAQILIDNFAPNQGESMDPFAVLALTAIRRGTP